MWLLQTRIRSASHSCRRNHDWPQSTWVLASQRFRPRTRWKIIWESSECIHTCIAPCELGGWGTWLGSLWFRSWRGILRKLVENNWPITLWIQNRLWMKMGLAEYGGFYHLYASKEAYKQENVGHPSQSLAPTLYFLTTSFNLRAFTAQK